MSAASALDRLTDALTSHGSAVRHAGGRIMAQCPAHPDNNPSLSIRGSEGQALVYCFAGCDTRDVLSAIGLSASDLFDDPRGATYRYDDGRVVRRTPDKQFRQSGNTKGAPQLYRLSKLAADTESVVHLVEGEKDVHAIESVGGLATCNPMGSTNFDKVDVGPLRGRIVVAVVDRDAGGLKWAAQVRARLVGYAASVTFVEAAVGKDSADHVAAGRDLTDFAQHEPESEPPGSPEPEPVGLDDFDPEDPWAGMVDDSGFPLEPEDATLDAGPTAEQEAYVEQVEATRAELGGEIPDAEAPEWVAQKFPSVDWASAYHTDFTQIDWLPGRFMERGQQVTLVGDGKVGKSLFALDWAFRTAAGRSFIGDNRHEPMRVLYFDRENSLRDIVTRAQALGAKPDDLANLIYKQFPQFDGALDASAKAGTQLVNLAVGYQAQVVILDTVSRFIAGKENDSDTWLQLFQLVHVKLKARGIACLRLDHFGKDAERGSRGSSAKSQDVDSVWELSKNGERRETADGNETVISTLKLARTHTRSGLGDDLYTVIRRGIRRQGGTWLTGGTRHELGDPGIVAAAQRQVDVIVDELIRAGVPRNAGRDAVRVWLKKNGGRTYANGTMADIVRELKARPE